eukprot:gnl/TRDRNA2_/TRDRNA2_129211_c0_seq1.p1 gnl/TRDRNA2_/TRDRNA2_129211_c0~~gnl/TRDRNA2_/TRDRNA2_129211_c0_seq1.p1  ORF type:complete len:507 (+),score=87.32 gnl/TRDRNA2_/TRDRNA2_129211_c0_seq1:73-1593(+)
MLWHALGLLLLSHSCSAIAPDEDLCSGCGSRVYQRFALPFPQTYQLDQHAYSGLMIHCGLTPLVARAVVVRLLELRRGDKSSIFDDHGHGLDHGATLLIVRVLAAAAANILCRGGYAPLLEVTSSLAKWFAGRDELPAEPPPECGGHGVASRDSWLAWAVAALQRSVGAVARQLGLNYGLWGAAVQVAMVLREAMAYVWLELSVKGNESDATRFANRGFTNNRTHMFIQELALILAKSEGDDLQRLRSPPDPVHGPIVLEGIPPFMARPIRKKESCNADPDDRTHRRPLLEVLEEQTGDWKDGYCYFQLLQEAEFSREKPSHFGIAEAASVFDWHYGCCLDGFFDGRTHYTPGTSAYDGMLVHDSGILGLPREILFNTSLLQEEGLKLCKRLKVQVPDHQELSMWHLQESTKIEKDVVALQQSVDYPDRPVLRPTTYNVLRHEVAKCLLRPGGVDLDIASGLYNHCILPDGHVGMGLQCRSDYFDAEHVRQLAFPMEPAGRNAAWV